MNLTKPLVLKFPENTDWQGGHMDKKAEKYVM
jgi:hypothetical protein